MVWWLRHHARNFFRSVMRPIPVDKARLWYKRSRIFYVMFGFLSFGYSYLIYKRHKHEIDSFPVFDQSRIQGEMRKKGMPGDVYIARIGLGQSTQIIRYNNTEYIKEYERKLKEYQDSIAPSANENQPDTNLS